MSEKNFGTILDALAERIEELKLSNYIKDLQIKELQEELEKAKGGSKDGTV